MKGLKTDEFIEKSKLIWGNRFDYSLVEYINNNTKVKIICPINGIFEQQPKRLKEGIKNISSGTDDHRHGAEIRPVKTGKSVEVFKKKVQKSPETH